MNELDLRKVKELFARLFVLAIQNKINFDSFIYSLERSTFLKKIQIGEYDDYFNKPLQTIFKDITNFEIKSDTSYGIYNDAYWCGYSYFELYRRLNKSFAFIFLKLPLKRMMDIYSIYHEMDISSLVDYFNKLDKEKTIMRLLCERKQCSITDISLATGINPATLSKYNASDDALYKASFQSIMHIVKFFDAPISLFVQNIIEL